MTNNLSPSHSSKRIIHPTDYDLSPLKPSPAKKPRTPLTSPTKIPTLSQNRFDHLISQTASCSSSTHDELESLRMQIKAQEELIQSNKSLLSGNEQQIQTLVHASKRVEIKEMRMKAITYFFRRLFIQGVYQSDMDKLMTLQGVVCYRGQTLDGTPHGSGIWWQRPVHTFIGNWERGVFRGYGELRIENEARYLGEFEHNTIHGYGSRTDTQGIVIFGSWSNGVFAGSGKRVNRNGSVYIGEFQDYQANGYGKLIYPNGYTYEGQWENNMLNGFGKIQLPNGDVYTGEVWNSKRHGYGKLVSFAGYVYEGSWNKDKQDGFGALTDFNPDGTMMAKYEGQFSMDKRQGIGRLLWSNGAFSEGYWVENVRNGYGETTFVGGAVYKGNYFNNMEDGDGEVAMPDGHRFEGSWRKGFKQEGRLFFPNGVAFKGKWRTRKMNEKKVNRIHGKGTLTYPSGIKIYGSWNWALFHPKNESEIGSTTSPRIMITAGRSVEISTVTTPDGQTFQAIFMGASNEKTLTPLKSMSVEAFMKYLNDDGIINWAAVTKEIPSKNHNFECQGVILCAFMNYKTKVLEKMAVEFPHEHYLSIEDRKSYVLSAKFYLGKKLGVKTLGLRQDNNYSMNLQLFKEHFVEHEQLRIDEFFRLYLPETMIDYILADVNSNKDQAGNTLYLTEFQQCIMDYLEELEPFAIPTGMSQLLDSTHPLAETAKEWSQLNQPSSSDFTVMYDQLFNAFIAKTYFEIDPETNSPYEINRLGINLILKIMKILN